MHIGPGYVKDIEDWPRPKNKKEVERFLGFTDYHRQFRHYLLGRHFTVRTDHNSLTWLMEFKEPQGQLARWLEELSQFDMEIQHRSGKKHTNADSLSRIPGGTMFRVQPESEIAGLAMWGCPYYTRAQSNWSGFDQEVDDVVPLAHKPRCQPVNKGQDRTDEEMGLRVTEIWVSTGKAGTRLRWESVKGVQVVQEVEGISLHGPGEDEIKDQQRLDPKLA
jgi:hypothetical protein